MNTVHFIDFPEDLQAIVEPVINCWIELLPTWCQEFRVRFDSDTNNLLASDTNYRNRWATIFIAASWFEEGQEKREIALLHEMFHILLGPLTAPLERAIKDITEEGTIIRSLTKSMIADGEEAAVEDMANAIYRMVRKTTSH